MDLLYFCFVFWGRCWELHADIQKQTAKADSDRHQRCLRASRPGNPVLSAEISDIWWESRLPFQQRDLLLSQRGVLGPGVEVLAKRGSFSLCPGCGAAPWLLLRFPGWWRCRAQPGAPKTHLSTASLTSVSSRETRLSRSLVLERNF